MLSSRFIQSKDSHRFMESLPVDKLTETGAECIAWNHLGGNRDKATVAKEDRKPIPPNVDFGLFQLVLKYDDNVSLREFLLIFIVNNDLKKFVFLTLFLALYIKTG